MPLHHSWTIWLKKQTSCEANSGSKQRWSLCLCWYSSTVQGDEKHAMSASMCFYSFKAIFHFDVTLPERSGATACFAAGPYLHCGPPVIFPAGTNPTATFKKRNKSEKVEVRHFLSHFQIYFFIFYTCNTIYIAIPLNRGINAESGQ